MFIILICIEFLTNCHSLFAKLVHGPAMRLRFRGLPSVGVYGNFGGSFNGNQLLFNRPTGYYAPPSIDCLRIFATLARRSGYGSGAAPLLRRRVNGAKGSRFGRFLDLLELNNFEFLNFLNGDEFYDEQNTSLDSNYENFQSNAYNYDFPIDYCFLALGDLAAGRVY